jgi:3-hydroxyisobutyrate dehydrogenase-like beta-hydroxyacid dehydrogenase
MKIGVLGQTGRAEALADRLMDAGHMVFRPRAEAATDFTRRGGQVVDAIALLAEHSEALVLALADDAALDAAIGALAPQLGKGHVILCLGRHRSSAKERARQHATTRGARLLDAEVIGSPAMIRAGAAAILLGGDATDLAQGAALLAAVAKHITLLDAFGKAARMKLVTD